MSDRLEELPDVAFYHFLSLLPLEQVVQLEKTYGNTKRRLFDDIRLEWAKKLQLPSMFTLKPLYEYTESNKNGKAMLLIEHGDYPNLIVIIYRYIGS